MHGLRADFGYIPEPDEVARKNTVLWRIAGATECAFLFKAALFQTDEVDVLARFAAWLELFVTYLRSDQRQTGAVYLDLGDVGSVPGVVGCDYREVLFAVPRRCRSARAGAIRPSGSCSPTAGCPGSSGCPRCSGGARPPAS